MSDDKQQLRDFERARGAEHEPLYLVALRVLIYALAAFVMLYGLALGAGLLGAMLGAAAAVITAHALAVGRVRLAVMASAALGAMVLGGVVNTALTDFGFAAGVLGVRGTLVMADFMVFGLSTFGFALGLRVISSRVPALAIVEVGVITLGVVRLLSGHRDHSISEPRWISDWVWSQGGDPIVVLLAIGALVLATVPLLLLVRQRAAKAALSIGALALMGLFAFALLRVAPPDPPTPTGGLGLTGKSEQEKDGARGGRGGVGDGTGGQGQGQSGNDPSEMPFKDEYPQGEPKPVAVVLLHDDYSAPDGYYYFRQTAFSHYNGHRLVRSFLDDSDPDLLEYFPYERREVSDLDRDARSFVELETTVALISDHKQPFGLANALAYESIDNPNPNTFRRAYKVESLAPRLKFRAMLDHEAGDPQWGEALRAQYTQAPDDPRYAELAQEILAEMEPRWRESPMAVALTLRRWLEKNTVYTRRSKHSDKADPTASFLFGSRRGYCVHLAHAMAFLLRSQGLPARVSAGYLVEEARRQSGSTVLIQNQDAHAWAEIYLDGLGWVVMDVAPEQAEDGEMAQINPELQRTLGELLRNEKKTSKELSRDTELPWGWLMLLCSALLVSGLTALAYGVKFWRRALAWRLGASGELYRLVYRAALDLLAEVGETRRYGETRESFAARTSARLPAVAPLTRAHMRRALGGDDPLTAAQWRALLSELRQQIAGHHPWWRRALGVINPVAWMQVR